jgi:hypothetical protein
MTFHSFLTVSSALIFIAYGALCIFNNHMADEFKRYDLERFRILTGFLELFGGLGSIIGLYNLPIFFISTGGLSILMLLGVITRLKVKDSFSQIIPAFTLMLVNAYLFWIQFL